MVYSIQHGPPGAGAEWGLAFVGPIGSFSSVVFDENMTATKPGWPDDGVNLTERNQKVYWTTAAGTEVRLTQA